VLAASRGRNTHPSETPKERLPGALQSHGADVDDTHTAWTYDRVLAQQRDLYARAGTWATLGATILSSITSAAIFASLQSDPSTAARVVVICISILAAALSGIQAFGLVGYRNEYKEAQEKWCRIAHERREELDTLLGGGSIDKAKSRKLLKEQLEAPEPYIPQRRFNRVSGEVEQDMIKVGYILAET
jgi:hypothetical protein